MSLEKKWYAYWQEQGFFHSSPNPDKEPYVIAMPPPNVTGVLHMGHILNNTIQDVLARKARMEGKEVCWIPGIDHASIATEAKVVQQLRTKGINNKAVLGREGFLREAWAWKERYGDIIIQQQKKLGLSADWERLRFTMDPKLSQAVIQAFVTLYHEGYIYRDKRMIHWDPEGKTALSDEEVNYREVQGYLYHIQYRIVGCDERVVVATTRPETLLGDMALCVHPEDRRYLHLQGKKAYVPLIDREIPIVADAYVDPAFGSGCLKVTPAHDPNDYLLSQRHRLPLLNILTEEGKLNEQAQRYVGEDRMVARKKIVQDLKAVGLLVKIVPHTHQVGFSERTGVAIEPRLSLQWFVKMKDLAQPAIQAVEEGTIAFRPKRFVKTYMSWMRQIRDWCISRQLWWGHRIPVYYLSDGRYVVAATLEEALLAAQKLTGNPKLTSDDLTQDPDVLDTWFSAWLWPMSIFEGTLEPDNPAFTYYYPTHDLVTAPEIIFFWVARMIMAGYKFAQRPPFRNVYFTGIVRDEQRRKMSKQLGNSPDALKMISQYGADGVRAGMLFCAPAGNDLLFDEKLCRQGQLFAHKIGHALRLVKGWKATEKPLAPIHTTAMEWFGARCQQVIGQVQRSFAQFRLSEALVFIYQLIRNDFCAHYLEMIKPRTTKAIPKKLYRATLDFFEQQLKLLHPFMPFVTEEVWHQLEDRVPGASIMVSRYPAGGDVASLSLLQANHAFALISKVRQLRKRYPIGRGGASTLYFTGEQPGWLVPFAPYCQKATGISAIKVAASQPPQTVAFVVGETSCWLSIPAEASSVVDRVAVEKQLVSQRKLLASVMGKLGNDRFLASAPPALVARERQKRIDTERRITALEALLKEGR